MRTIFGVFALNERRALGRMEKSVPRNAVFVVDCDDGSKEFLLSKGRKVLYSDSRRGKAGAVSDFLNYCRRERAEFAVLVQADTMPNAKFFSEIQKPLEENARAGIVVARVDPVGPDSFCGFFGKLNWEMHNRFCERGRPKAGEICLRVSAVTNLPREIINEDAFLQTESEMRGYETTYFPKAVVRIGTPENLPELVSQRRRIASGHFQLARIGRKVPTADLFERISVFLETAPEISNSQREVFYSAVAPFVELLATILGVFDSAFGLASPAWEPLESTKKDLKSCPKYNKFKKN